MTVLTDLLEAETGRTTFPAAEAVCQHLRETYGSATAAVVFYGSCLRHSTDINLMLDFYVLVDNYRSAFGNPVPALFAWLLPPNVYYHDVKFEDRVVRAKVAVISVAQFLHGAGGETFSSSLWARFAQPTRLMYASNPEIHRRIIASLAGAVEAMIHSVAPLMPPRFGARELWARAFGESYAAELRPERESKCLELVDADLVRYTAVTAAVLGVPDVDGLYDCAASGATEAQARGAWRLRRIQGKTLNVLRLIKAAFTFKGGLDYAAWKIERHSGVKVEITERDRKHPLMTGARLLLKTLQRGGLR